MKRIVCVAPVKDVRCDVTMPSGQQALDAAGDTDTIYLHAGTLYWQPVQVQSLLWESRGGILFIVLVVAIVALNIWQIMRHLSELER